MITIITSRKTQKSIKKSIRDGLFGVIVTDVDTLIIIIILICLLMRYNCYGLQWSDRGAYW